MRRNLTLVLLAGSFPWAAWAERPAPPAAAPAAGNTAAPAGARRISFGGEIRGRLESLDGIAAPVGERGGVYLHRARLEMRAAPFSTLRLFVQLQDSRVAGWPQSPAPVRVRNQADFRQAYVEFGDAEQGVVLRAGRQALIFGDSRLMSTSNWSNVGPAYDGARLTLRRGRAALDLFSAAPVKPLGGAWDRPAPGRRVHGAYGALSAGAVALEPYLLVKTDSRARGELGGDGAYSVFTGGMRSFGPLAGRLGYEAEMAVQGGSLVRDSIRASAGHWEVQYQVSPAAGSPQLIGEYNFASGDRALGDGRRGTFDHFYPTHKYGTADNIGWQNIHEMVAAAEWKPGRNWRLRANHRNFWLASRADALYSMTGAELARNPKAKQRIKPLKRIFFFILHPPFEEF